MRESRKGALHPPHSYQAGEWTWQEKNEGFAAAIRDSFNSINKQDYAFPGEIAARVTSIKNDSTMSDCPQEFYHPQDRPTLDKNLQALDSEVDAAMLARSLGYSLGIMDVDDFSPLQLLNPEAETHRVQARWSLDDHYELFPPLYVGHSLGSRFAMELHNEIKYEFWDSARYVFPFPFLTLMLTSSGYDWARKAKRFRQYDLEISRQGLIKIAVTVQRFVRAGFPIGRPSLDDLIVYYHHRSEQGANDPQILEEWQQRTARLETNILTTE